MATTTNLGRVQGGGLYTSTSIDETNIPIASVAVAGVRPLVGDTIINANGAMCRVIAFDASTYTVEKYGMFRPATSEDTEAVHFTPQSLTTEQQAQARANIAAQPAGDYATKAEIETAATAEVICAHELEITGNTGDEHGLAIGDQQMLLTKIQGQTRRKNLNLFPITSAVTINSGSEQWVWYEIADMQSWGMQLGKTYKFKLWNAPAGVIAQLLPNYYNFSENDVTYELTPTLRLRIGNNNVSTTVTFLPQLSIIEISSVTDTIPAYEHYDSTLVNAKCDFVSTGRNLLAPNIYVEDIYYLSLGYAELIKGETYYLKSPNYAIGERVDFRIIVGNDAGQIYSRVNLEAGFSFVSNLTGKYRLQLYSANGYAGSLSADGLMLNVGTTAMPYEPYKAETFPFGVPLGQWDYWQENVIYRNTSEIKTFPTDGWTKRNNLTAYQFIRSVKGYNPNSNYKLPGVSNLYEWRDRDVLWGMSSGSGFNINGADEFIICDFSITSVEELIAKISGKQFVYQTNEVITEPYFFAGGYAVYNDGMQAQVTETLPYILTKRYSLNAAAQLLANIETDREQQAQISSHKVYTHYLRLSITGGVAFMTVPSTDADSWDFYKLFAYCQRSSNRSLFPLNGGYFVEPGAGGQGAKGTPYAIQNGNSAIVMNVHVFIPATGQTRVETFFPAAGISDIVIAT